MEPVPAAALEKLKLEDAVRAEAASTRNLLPNEPGWDKLTSRAKAVAEFCENRLKAGYEPAPEVEIAARKPGHGVRPVPYWSLLDRVIYRAFTTAALKDGPDLDRTPEAYLHFARAPIDYAFELEKEAATSSAASGQNDVAIKLFFFRTPIRYIVKSDVTAFYQFIDQSILADNLLLAGSDYDIIEGLMQLLGEVQGRKFGLPQLLDSSDELSEIYIDAIERDLLREGFATWRFNDDFRIACRDYTSALNAIEAISSALRQAGLAMSDSKTFTIGFANYVLDTVGKKRSDLGDSISQDQVEDIVGDYTDEFGEERVDDAVQILELASPRDDGRGVDLRNARTDDVRLLRRALNGLISAVDARGLGQIRKIVTYVPSMTPDVMRYISAVRPTDRDVAELSLDQLLGSVSLNDWQKIWIVDTMRSLQMLDSQNDAHLSRLTWIEAAKSTTNSEALKAVAAHAQATAGGGSIEQIIEAAFNAPECLLAHYTSAALAYRDRQLDASRADVEKHIAAFKRYSKLHDMLLSD